MSQPCAQLTLALSLLAATYDRSPEYTVTTCFPSPHAFSERAALGL